ncbi:AAA family ATPase [Bacteroidota bacterium]
MPHQINTEKLQEAFGQYLNACTSTDWLQIQEIYKFRFGRWLYEKVDFSNQPNEAILQLCIDSQGQKFDGIEKGVNFLKSTLRFQGEFIQLKDIQIIREINEGTLPNREMLQNTSISLPKFSAWLATLIPEKFNTCPNIDLTDALAWLFDMSSIPKRGFNSFQKTQELMESLRIEVKHNLDQFKPIANSILGYPDILPIDEVWLVQDFILYIHRKIISNKMKFTWVPFFEELADKILVYEDNHQALIQILKEAGITDGFKDYDMGDKPIELDDIDPFTFLSFIMKYGEDKRKIYLEKIKSQMGMQSDLPLEFNGVPSTDPRHVWLFAFKKDRDQFDIPNLWRLFLQSQENSIDPELFGTVLKIKGTGKASLTQNLFKLSPKEFFPIDKHTQPYLKERGITYDFNSLEDYLKIIDEVRLKLSKPLYEVSYDAWSETQGKSEEASLEESRQIYDSPVTGFPLNQILYGPPGTGKTYQTINYALAIIENKSLFNISQEEKENGRDALLTRFNEYKKRKQIEFVTFHQSFSYEDFIEGIKPVLKDSEKDHESVEESYSEDVNYIIDPGVFRRIAEQARSYIDYIEQKPGKIEIPNETLENAEFYKMSLGDTHISEDIQIYDYCIENNCISLGYGGNVNYESLSNREDITNAFKDKHPDGSDFNIDAIERFKNWMQEGDIVFISYGNRILRAVGIITSDYYFDNKTKIRHNHFRKVEWLGTDLKIPVEEVYEKNFSQQTIYQMFKSKIRKEFFLQSTEIDKNKVNHVLIIDEINRGNISKIFGELITLIEKDKRFGKTGYFEVTLPYSKRKFSVPLNLYLLGTMNTSDRSIALLDTALRRRFHFVEFMPEPGLLENDLEGIDLTQMLSTINERITFLIDRDHTIGHSYFMNLESYTDLCRVFRNNIIPLLQEYFYNDWYKIQLVLGDNDERKKKNEHKFIQTLQTYNSSHEVKLFGLDLEDYEEVSTYAVNGKLMAEDYGSFPKDAFLFIYRSPVRQESDNH